jgi:serine/threonine-protein kinase
VEQVASALDAAHEIGLVHRDVKPGNVLLAKNYHAYLTDFGITKRREAGTDFTKTGDFLGTVDYAAPEQIRGEPVDGRADVYALGCVTYECLTGEPPFSREAEVAVMYAHLNDSPPRPTAVRPELPAAIDPVMATAMAKRADRRYESAGELATAVREALGPVVPTKSISSAAEPATSRRFPAIAAGAALAIAIAVTVLAVTVFGGHPSGPPTRSNGSPSTSSSSTGTTPSARPSSTAIGPPPGVAVRLNTVAELDGNTGRVLHDFKVGTSPGSITFSGGHVWVVNDGSGTITRIDPKSGRTSTKGGVPSPCLVSPASDGGVWVSSCKGGFVAHVRPDFSLGRAIRVQAPGEAAEDHGSLWVVSERTLSSSVLGKDVVERIDPATGRVLKAIPVGSGAADIMQANGALWGCNSFDATIWRIDPKTDHATTIPAAPFDYPVRIANGDAGFWVSDRNRLEQMGGTPFGVIGVDHADGALVPVVSGLDVWTVGGIGAFVGREKGSSVPEVGFSRRITKIDQATGAVVVQYQLPYATDAVAGDGSVWISAGPVRSSLGFA